MLLSGRKEVFKKERTRTKTNNSALVASNNLDTVAVCYYPKSCNPFSYVKCLHDDFPKKNRKNMGKMMAKNQILG